jgi:hypothetical protein
MAKSVSKSLKKTSKKLSNKAKSIANNTIRVNNATLKKVNVNNIGKAPGSSKSQVMSRRTISHRNTSEDTLRKLVSNYAKTANKRLRNLEKGNVQEASAAYRQIRTFSRDGRDFMGTTKNNEFKFRTDVKKMDKDTLRREAMELDTFLFRSKTSTVKGVKSLYKSIKEKIGRQNAEGTKAQFVMDYFNNMSMEDFNQFWENQSMHEMISWFGSDEVITLIKEGEDKGIDLEKMNDMFSKIDNDMAKTMSIKELENMIRKDIQIEMTKRQTGANIAADTQNIIDHLESTEPVIGVDEDGFMKLW